jgi:hypothetical protein
VQAPKAAQKAERLEELHYCQMCLPGHDRVAEICFRRELCIIPPVIGAAFPPGRTTERGAGRSRSR